MEHTFQFNIVLTITRCYRCHRYYGYERTDQQRCPHCAEAAVNKLNQELEHLKRSNASLKGAGRRKRR